MIFGERPPDWWSCITIDDVRRRFKLLDWNLHERPVIIAALNRCLVRCWMRRRKERT